MLKKQLAMSASLPAWMRSVRTSTHCTAHCLFLLLTASFFAVSKPFLPADLERTLVELRVLPDASKVPSKVPADISVV
jgi:hypothetical protein